MLISFHRAKDCDEDVRAEGGNARRCADCRNTGACDCDWTEARGRDDRISSWPFNTKWCWRDGTGVLARNPSDEDTEYSTLPQSCCISSLLTKIRRSVTSIKIDLQTYQSIIAVESLQSHIIIFILTINISALLKSIDWSDSPWYYSVLRSLHSKSAIIFGIILRLKCKCPISTSILSPVWITSTAIFGVHIERWPAGSIVRTPANGRGKLYLRVSASSSSLGTV